MLEILARCMPIHRKLAQGTFLGRAYESLSVVSYQTCGGLCPPSLQTEGARSLLQTNPARHRLLSSQAKRGAQRARDHFLVELIIRKNFLFLFRMFYTKRELHTLLNFLCCLCYQEI